MLQMTREGYIIYQHIEFYQIPLNMIFSTEIGGGCASRLAQNYPTFPEQLRSRGRVRREN